MTGRWTKTLMLTLGVALATQSLGCGTLLHPERRGQRGGNADVTIVVLDAIGLLFFLIPGIIAFAVDFSNGTIYLPRGRYHSQNLKDLDKVSFDTKGDVKATVERILRERTGVELKLDGADVQVVAPGSRQEMLALFARAQASGVALR